MPATDFQDPSLPFSSLGRSILTLRRDNALEIDAFQQRLADLLLDLAGAGDLLSLPWLRRLLDAFLLSQDHFRALLLRSSDALARPPLDRIATEFFDRSVKALDVLNAVRDGVAHLRQWRHHLEIVVAALSGPSAAAARGLGEGQVRRARKALTDLAMLALEEKDSGGGSSLFAHRNRSFGRSGKDGPQHRRMGSGGSSASASSSAAHHRSLSWSVSRSWSAARQLQAMGSNLAAPRAAEVAATNGVAATVYSMSSVLLFVMWALVAAIPCQDRGLQAHFSVPRTFPWAAPLLSMHERILEESKRKDRKNSSGLLKEIVQIERLSRQLSEILEQVEFPVTEEKESEVRTAVEELAEVCGGLKGELDTVERQIREVFRRIVRSRSEGLESLSKSE